MSIVFDLAVTDVTLSTMSAILEYRYLTMTQVVTINGVKPKSASEMLLRMKVLLADGVDLRPNTGNW